MKKKPSKFILKAFFCLIVEGVFYLTRSTISISNIKFELPGIGP